MRAPATTTRHTIAALLAALALSAVVPAAAQSPLRAAQASSDDDAPTPPEAQSPAPAEPAEEPQAAAEAAEPRQPLEFGVSRRIDPFDDNDDVPAPATSAPANHKFGVVICVAGCDKPRDASVRSRN